MAAQKRQPRGKAAARQQPQNDGPKRREAWLFDTLEPVEFQARVVMQPVPLEEIADVIAWAKGLPEKGKYIVDVALVPRDENGKAVGEVPMHQTFRRASDVIAWAESLENELATEEVKAEIRQSLIDARRAAAERAQ